ncbi:MAG: hypothetical protein KFW09_05925 [Oscillospiraceae bacterium]|nr:hypothetical protein [Oscillospiraceae bacterium]
MKLNKKYIFSIIGVSIMSMNIIIASAAVGNWGNIGLHTMRQGQGYTKTSVYDLKEDSAEKSADFYTITKSSWTNPSVKLVNSNDEERSEKTELRTGRTTKSEKNRGLQGHIYYASVKPDNLQIGDDSVKFQVRAR